MTTRIMGLSGKKQSGKSTSANHLCGIKLKSKGLIDDFRLADDGMLHVLTKNADGVQAWGELDMTRTDEDFVSKAQQDIWPYVKLYSFADALKSMCVNLLEIPYETIYGTNKQKDELTHLLWENMPGVITDEELWNHILELYPEGLEPVDLVYHATGYMTGREVMQYFGTDVMRGIYGPVWINNTLKRIAAEQTELALITDIRFPNESDGVVKFGGEVIRLLRELSPDDRHSSETQLDSENYDHNKFTFLINNTEQPIGFLQGRLDKIYMGEIKKVEFTGFKTKELSNAGNAQNKQEVVD